MGVFVEVSRRRKEFWITGQWLVAFKCCSSYNGELSQLLLDGKVKNL